DDIAGFGIRLRAGGKRSWVFQYAMGKLQRRMTFGAYPALDATRARGQAARLHAQIKLGQDPAGNKAESKARAHETFEHGVQQYLMYQRERLRPRAYTEVERHLLKHAKLLHGLQLGKVDKRTIAARLNEIGRDSGFVTANRVRAT